MNVVDHLRVPHILHSSYRQLRFHLREHVPVAIVVVPNVGMKDFHRLRAFERRAHVLAIPLRHHVLAIRIHRWHQQENHVIQNLAVLRSVFGQQPVDVFHGRLRGRHFVGVYRAGDEYHGTSLRGQFRRFILGEPAWVRQTLLDLQVAIEMTQVVGGRNGQLDERFPPRRFPNFLELDAVRRCGRQFLKVIDYLPPIGQFAILPHVETQHGIGVRNLRPQREGRKVEAEKQQATDRRARPRVAGI